MKVACIFMAVFFLLQPFLGGSNAKSVSALKTDDASITVDGKPDEEIWQKTQPISDFLQYEPSKGVPASFATQVRVLYTTKYIYFGIIAHDPQPQKVTARVNKREGEVTGDDSIAIALDTFHDRQTAYIFFTNLAGIQKDARLADNGRTFDDTWDGKWLSAGFKTETGWTAEIAIPFETLKYKTGQDETWGLGIARFIPRNLEIDTWSGPVESYQRVSQFGVITGLDLRETEKKNQFIPHVIAKIEKDKKSEIEAGLDVRCAFSQSVSGDLTVNPDFAIVEADQEQINLTRFELSLKEKRNFFLEGAEIYQQRYQLFYSRRIGDIYGGLKVYGKSKGYEFSALSAQGKKDDVAGIGSANFSVLRFRKNFARSSNIGFLLANKLIKGKFSGTAGIDIVHFFSEKVNLTGQLAVSYGEQNNQNIAFYLRPSYDSSTFHIHLRYTQLGAHFADNANSVGFIPDDDRRELDSAVEKTWWLGKNFLERIQYLSNYNIYWSTQAGTLRSWQIDQELGFDFSNKLSLGIAYSREFKHYEKDFQNHRLGFSLSYNTREWQSVRVRYESGRNFDLDYVLFGGGFNVKLGKKFSVEYELNRLQLTPDPEQESTWLHVLRVSHYFGKDLFLKVFFQSNSVIDKENIQVVFMYRFQPPFGTLQLAYQRGTGRFGEKGHQGDTLFLKFSYVL
ncbi:MAG TPA: DUF5916 domain-containing protein [Candidatus Kapabacteria bacterium]|nr:DUF5916 domain-containing protein [Candidatus Kapabacteria bacterium]